MAAQASEVLVELAHALHHAGTPAAMVEETFDRVATRLGVELQVFASLTVIMASVGPPEHGRTIMLRVTPQPVHLGRISAIEACVDDFIHGETSRDTLLAQLRRLAASTDRTHPAVAVAISALGAAAWARLFGGGTAELAAAATVGLVIGAVGAIAHRGSGALSHTREMIAGMTAAIVTALVARWLPPLRPDIPILAGIIALLPGVSLVIGAEEVARKDLITGTVRLVWSALLFCQLLFGVAIGSQLAAIRVAANPVTTPDLASFGTSLPFVIVAVGWFASLQSVRGRDVPWFLGFGVFGWCAAHVASPRLGFLMGGFVATLLVVLASHATARVRGGPHIVTTFAGISALVPGSLGFRGALELWNADAGHGLKILVGVVLLMLAVALGLLAAAGILPPRRRPPTPPS